MPFKTDSEKSHSLTFALEKFALVRSQPVKLTFVSEHSAKEAPEKSIFEKSISEMSPAAKSHSLRSIIPPFSA